MRPAPIRRPPDLHLRAELREGHLFRCLNPDCEALLTRSQVLEHHCPTHREIVEQLAGRRLPTDADGGGFPARGGGR